MKQRNYSGFDDDDYSGFDDDDYSDDEISSWGCG